LSEYTQTRIVLIMEASAWPDQETVLALVRRLPDDAVASAEFLALLYPILLQEIQSTHPTDDPAQIVDVVGDLLFAFVKAPEQYDSTRLPIRAYLKMAADGDLRNARAKVARRRAREIPFERVAEQASDGNEESEDDGVLALLADPRVAAAIAGFDALERSVWDLMRSGDRSTATCATILGMHDRPLDEQEREVKRVKDRIKTRLRRAWEAAQ
jgi:DNA-directed RNA polymerase specialized sigma24 family protein